MKKVEKLQIYRTTYEYMSVLYDYVAKFPKLAKYSLGTRIIDKTTELFTILSKSYRLRGVQNSLDCVDEFLITFESLKPLIRLCSEKYIISVKQTARLAIFEESITNQINGWKSYLRNTIETARAVASKDVTGEQIINN